MDVANTDQGTIVRIRVVNGEPRQPTIWVLSPALLGADGIAFDVRSNLYVAVDRQNTIAVVRPDGEIGILARRESGLDYPASTSFGQTDGQITFLFWTNSGINFQTPSVQKMDVGIPGAPLP